MTDPQGTKQCQVFLQFCTLQGFSNLRKVGFSKFIGISMITITWLFFLLSWTILVSCGKNELESTGKYKIIHNDAIGILEQEENFQLQLNENFSIGKDDTSFFTYATHIALDSEGNIFVLDRGNLRIGKFDSAGNLIRFFGRRGNGPGEFLYPRDMGISPDCVLCVLDNKRIRMIKYSTDGEFLGEFALGSRRYKKMLLRSNKSIIVIGPKNDKIFQIYSMDGKFIRSVGAPIDFFDANRKYLRRFNKRNRLYFRTPGTVAIDKNDFIIHSYFFANRLRIFDNNYQVKYVIERDDPDFTPVIELEAGFQFTAGCVSILRLSDGRIIQFLHYSKDFENPDDDVVRMEIYDDNGRYLAGKRMDFEGYGAAVDENDNILFVVNKAEKSYITSYRLLMKNNFQTQRPF